METKKQLAKLLGFTVFELLMHEGLRTKYERAKKFASLANEVRELRQGKEVRIKDDDCDFLRQTPVFGQDGRLRYINVPLIATA